MQFITRNIVSSYVLKTSVHQNFHGNTPSSKRNNCTTLLDFFFAKLIPKSPKSWLSMFSVPCWKYCRSVQKLWDSVHCSNHKYIGMFWYWTGVSKSREWSGKNFSICIHLHKVCSGEQRKSICMRHTCYMHTCTIELFLSIFTLHMYPIRASQSTCFVASDYPIRGIYGVTKTLISRGTFGVLRTINLRLLILMVLMYFSTNNFPAEKKFILSIGSGARKKTFTRRRYRGAPCKNTTCFHITIEKYL